MKKNLLVMLLSLLIPFSAGIAEAAPAVGDIILSDGSVVGAQDLSAWEAERAPIAVVAAVDEGGSLLGLGVHRSEETLSWAPEGSTGHAVRFSGIESWLEDAEDALASQAAFSGVANGSGSWQAICLADAAGTQDAAKNYPAFHFVQTYADRFGLTGDAAGGWYLPSIAEVCTVYANREAVNASLRAIHALDPEAAMDGLGTNWYWSSSQSALRDDYAWFVHFFNGYASDCPKDFTNLHALAVKRF